MASTINGTSTGNGGLISTGDDSGILNIQTNETTAISINASQAIGVGSTPSFGTNGQFLTSAGTSAAPTWTTAVASQWTTSGANIYYTTGSVGIGTVTPSAPLEVFKTSNKTAIFGNATQNNGNYITLTGASTTKNWVISNNMIVGAEFGIGRTSANGGTDIGTTHDLMIDTSGNVLIGTTTNASGSKFRVYASGQNNTEFERETTGLAGVVSFRNPNGAVGSIQTSGSSTLYNTSSDYRLKESIAPMTGALAKVSLLKPCTYKWKVDGSDGQGFIAHELAEIVPDCVSGEKDAVDANENPIHQGVDTSFLVATLTAAIQELKAINDTQAETINALTARIVALEGQ